MGEIEEYADAGGLISYAADEGERYRRAAWYVDKILKGAKLRNSSGTTNEVRTGNESKDRQADGLTVPQSVLFRADRVIR